VSAWPARLALVLGLLGCGGRTDSPPVPASGPLGAGVIARVGTTEIAEETVARIAAAQRVDAATARDLAVRDALLATGARSLGLDAEPSTAFATQAVLARSLLRELMAEAVRAGPVTDEELRTTTARHWLELDRPEGFRTVHAVVRLDAKADPATRKRAVEIAEAIRREVAPVQALAVTTPPPPPGDPSKPPKEDDLVEPFRKAATSVPHQDLELVVEALAPVAADGRVVTPDPGSFDAKFSEAASKLAARGDVSPPVVSSFGVHIIFLLERQPAISMPVEERRALLTSEVMTDRARAAQRRLLEGIRKDIGLDRNVDAWLALVAVDR